MQVFTVALTRQFALYRKCCSLTAAMFVGFMFIKINMKCFSPAASSVYVMLLCRIIIQSLQKLISYLRSTHLLFGRKLGAWRDDKHRMHYIGLGTRKIIILLSTGYGEAKLLMCICTDSNVT
jgi:ABC-type branched-subunit amino acid transport system permease subunit